MHSFFLPWFFSVGFLDATRQAFRGILECLSRPPPEKVEDLFEIILMQIFLLARTAPPMCSPALVLSPRTSVRRSRMTFALASVVKRR